MKRISQNFRHRMVLGISLMAYFVDSDTKCFNVAVEFLSQNFYFIVLEMWNSD